jgi:hypothetical protein
MLFHWWTVWSVVTVHTCACINQECCTQVFRFSWWLFRWLTFLHSVLCLVRLSVSDERWEQQHTTQCKQQHTTQCNNSTLRSVKTKRWLSFEKWCSFETSFKILHDCHFFIGCLYFMLKKLIDPAERTACSAQNKEEQKYCLTTMFISSWISVWLCSKVQRRLVQLDRHFCVLIVWWAVRLANFPVSLSIFIIVAYNCLLPLPVSFLVLM